MSGTQPELNNNCKKGFGHFRKFLPDLAGQLGVQINEAYKDGAMAGKTKRLMAVLICFG